MDWLLLIDSPATQPWCELLPHRELITWETSCLPYSAFVSSFFDHWYSLFLQVLGFNIYFILSSMYSRWGLMCLRLGWNSLSSQFWPWVLASFVSASIVLRLHALTTMPGFYGASCVLGERSTSPATSQYPSKHSIVHHSSHCQHTGIPEHGASCLFDEEAGQHTKSEKHDHFKRVEMDPDDNGHRDWLKSSIDRLCIKLNYIKAYPPSIYECGNVRKWSLCRCNWNKMTSLN